MSDLVLGVDCSTTASKVIAWDRHGKALAEGRALLREIRPRPLYSEQAAEGWWDATAEALANLMKSITSDHIVGLCITHQRESYAPVDENNHSLRNAICGTTGVRRSSWTSWASASAMRSCIAARDADLH